MELKFLRFKSVRKLYSNYIFPASEVNARSQARIISGLKSFFGYLIFEDYRLDNPLELIESPKTGRKLPDILSVDEIDSYCIHRLDFKRGEQPCDA
jgi:integrase/recombinase XerD